MASYIESQFIAAGLPNVETWALDVALNYPAAQPLLQVIDPASGNVVRRDV